MQAARVAAADDPALAVNGGGKGPVSSEWMVPKALWLKENEPEVFDRAAHICEYQVGGAWVGAGCGWVLCAGVCGWGKDTAAYGLRMCYAWEY